MTDRIHSWSVPLFAGCLAVMVRMDEWRHADVFIDSDNALGPLMARHIWRDGYRPLMLSGQDYVGALEAYLYAPLLSCFDTAHAFATVVLALFVLTMWPLYKLLLPVGGRRGATAGLLVWAVGSPWWTALTTTAPMSYMSNLLLGLTLLVVVRSPPSPRRLSCAGFIVGLGYWNNPMFLAFALAAFAAWIPFTATFGRSGPLPPAARPGLASCALGAAAAIAILLLPFSGIRSVAGLSLTHPERYLPRALIVILLGAAWVDKAASGGRWRRGVALLVSSVALGALPLIVYRVSGQTVGHGARLQFSLEHALDNLCRLAPLIGEVTIGEQTTLGLLIDGSLIAVLIVWLIRHRDVLANLPGLRVVRPAPGGVLLLPALATICLLELRGGLQWHRYLIPVMLVVPTLVAWANAASRGRWRWLGGLLLVVILVNDGLQQREEHMRLVQPQLHRQVVRDLRDCGVTHGLGQYWVCYRFSALLDDGLRLGCSYDGGGNRDRLPWYRDEAHDAERSGLTLVALYDLDGGVVELCMPERAREDPALVREFLDEHGANVRRRCAWGGRYLAFFYERR